MEKIVTPIKIGHIKQEPEAPKPEELTFKNDFLGSLQHNLNDLAFIITNSVGITQRDSPSIEDLNENPDHPVNDAQQSIDELTKEFAVNLITASKEFEKKLDILGEKYCLTDEQLNEKLDELEKKNEDMREEVLDAKKKGDRLLKSVKEDISIFVEEYK